MPLGMLFVMKTLEDEQYVGIKAYKFTIYEEFLLRVHTISTYRVYHRVGRPACLWQGSLSHSCTRCPLWPTRSVNDKSLKT